MTLPSRLSPRPVVITPPGAAGLSPRAPGCTAYVLHACDRSVDLSLNYPSIIYHLLLYLRLSFFLVDRTISQSIKIDSIICSYSIHV